MKNLIKAFNNFSGLSHNKTSHREKVISGIGGFISIYLILVVTHHYINAEDATLVVASMGASAVLLFAVPHGPLSQPWALGCGQLVSAFIGVTSYQMIPDIYLAAAVAVGLSITVMYYLRCIHPPGGATALSAVIAGPGVHELGYYFMLTPVLINVLVIFAVALTYNSLFYWRRYPAMFSRYTETTDTSDKPVLEGLGRIQLESALQQMNQFIDVSHEDLEKIFQLARNQINSQLKPSQLKPGHYYSNGSTGADWSVWQIVDEADDHNDEDGLIIYKVVAGKGRPGSGTTRRKDFAQWAKYEVYLNERSWERVLVQDQAEAVNIE
ncbi:HPP family protein [Kaarinaea lacus]